MALDFFDSQTLLDELADRGVLVGEEVCDTCEGSGQRTDFHSDPDNCGNCAWGDCDYGHPFKSKCFDCGGTGRRPRART